MVEKTVCPSHFNEFANIHDGNPVRYIFHNAEVMRDKKVCQVQFVFKRLHELKNCACEQKHPKQRRLHRQ